MLHTHSVYPTLKVTGSPEKGGGSKAPCPIKEKPSLKKISRSFANGLSIQNIIILQATGRTFPLLLLEMKRPFLLEKLYFFFPNYDAWCGIASVPLNWNHTTQETCSPIIACNYSPRQTQQRASVCAI